MDIMVALVRFIILLISFFWFASIYALAVMAGLMFHTAVFHVDLIGRLSPLGQRQLGSRTVGRNVTKHPSAHKQLLLISLKRLATLYERRAVAAQTARSHCKALSIQCLYYFRAYQRQRTLHDVGVVTKLYFGVLRHLINQ